MAVGDILEVVLGFQNVVRGDQYRNILHFIVNTDDAVLSNEQALATTFNLQYVNDVLPLQNVACRFLFTSCQRVFPLPRTAGAVELNGLGTVGAIAGEALPPACAMVIRKRTALAGRRYRGRVFVPMLSESDQVNGVWTGGNPPAIGAAWTNLLTLLMTGAGGGEYSPVLWPRTGTSSGDATLITAAQRDEIVRQQRRREVGRGI